MSKVLEHFGVGAWKLGWKEGVAPHCFRVTRPWTELDATRVWSAVEKEQRQCCARAWLDSGLVAGPDAAMKRPILVTWRAGVRRN
jgi:hypothetical protein